MAVLMIGKLLLKIVFKASLPMVAVAGVLSYGLYLKGGDPMALWSTVASRTLGSIRENSANTVQTVQALTPSVISGSSSKSGTTVYTWVDNSGTTHYGSNPPTGVMAEAMNLRSHTPSVSNGPASPVASAALPEHEEPLPGMAGVKLPVSIEPEDLGLTREELLRMIGK